MTRQSVIKLWLSERLDVATHRPHNGGFSLIELAIVLVILGLVTGGILTGQDLIRNAELKQITTDFARYKQAVNQFQDTYLALPGDMADATDYWGFAAGTTGTDAACYNATSANNTSCNGNGNGKIFQNDGQANNAPEWFHAWVQLKAAGYIEGNFTGRRAADDRQAVPGQNVPKGPFSNSGYTLMNYLRDSSATLGDAQWYNGSYRTMIFFGGQTSASETSAAILTAEEAWGIDTKTDDGIPGLGIIRTFNNDASCVSATGVANQLTATYNLQADGEACSLIYSFDDPGTP